MEREIEQTLFGWRVADSRQFKEFYLTEKERSIAIKTLCEFFTICTVKNIDVKDILKKKCESNLYPLAQTSFDRIVATCNSLLHSFGPLDALLNMDVEEITLSLGPARVFKTNCGWSEAGLEVTNESYLKHVVDKLASTCGRRLTIGNPTLNAFLPNGTRIHVVSPPVSPGLTVSIRKFKQTPFTLQQLVDGGILHSAAARFIENAVSNSSIIVAGNTGSGKTTTLNTLLSLLPANDRFVFVEDVSELTLPSHSHKARLLAEGVPLSRLVYEALRMRPDRLVVSEIRSEQEVKAFADALLSGGGKTCYTTFHAASAKEVLRRLRLLGFKKADLDSIGLIIVQKRFDDKNGREKRRITEIAKVKNGEVVLIPLAKERAVAQMLA